MIIIQVEDNFVYRYVYCISYRTCMLTKMQNIFDKYVELNLIIYFMNN